jgi:hypothetical protein
MYIIPRVQGNNARILLTGRMPQCRRQNLALSQAIFVHSPMITWRNLLARWTDT